MMSERSFVDIAASALDHSDHVEHLVRWSLLKIVHIDNGNAGRIQDCLSHLSKLQEDLKELVVMAKNQKEG